MIVALFTPAAAFVRFFEPRTHSGLSSLDRLLDPS